MNSKPADDLVQQMWDFGNVITAFTVAQSLAVIYFALEKRALVHAWRDHVWIAIVLIVAGAGAYATAIWSCYRAETRLRAVLDHPEPVLATSRFAARGRVVTALLFNGMAASATALAAS